MMAVTRVSITVQGAAVINVTISREQARQLDRRAVDEYGMASVMLMENAGRGVADCLCQLGIDGVVVVCCGAGNNGGDGYVVARHLDLRGHEARVLALADPAGLTGDAALNYRVLAKSGVPIRRVAPEDLGRELEGAAWIVDALLGTGARGDPRPPLDRVIDQINAERAAVLAVDVPSGLDCDTGQPAANTIRAAHTCTFVAAKPRGAAQAGACRAGPRRAAVSARRINRSQPAASENPPCRSTPLHCIARLASRSARAILALGSSPSTCAPQAARVGAMAK
jgi:NAD(P)H-hydrate epimerase